MGDGLATTGQLAAFSEQFKTFGQRHSIWMSATLDREWLRHIDFASRVDQLRRPELSDADRSAQALERRLNAVKYLSRAPEACRLPSGLAAFVKGEHKHGTQTLIVVKHIFCYFVFVLLSTRERVAQLKCRYC